MPSLTQLLTNHRSVLVLDAASMTVQVGVLRDGLPAVWRNAPQEAGTGIFAGTDAALQSAKLGLPEIGAFVFCEGPGSMLGIRTVAMALRTWELLYSRPMYSYQSLALTGAHEWSLRPRPFAVIADARRDSWHWQAVGTDGWLAPLQRRPASDLPPGELATPAGFRAWAPLPRESTACAYDLAVMLPALAAGDFFRPVQAPDAFQHEPPEYKKWSARIHQAAVPSP